VLKQVNFQAKTNPNFRDVLGAYEEDLVYKGDTEVLHYVEVLERYVGFHEVKSKVKTPLRGKKIGAYYGCLMLRPDEVMDFDDPEDPDIMERLLTALGAVAVPFACRNECCGGYKALDDKDKTLKLSEKIADSAVNKGAELLVTACPLCEFNINETEIIPVTYFTEVLRQALNEPDEGV